MRISALTLGLAGVVLSIAATAGAEDVAKISIPFDFKVGTKMLPAGQYEVRIDQETPDVVQLSGLDHRGAHADVLTIPDYHTWTSKGPELTFTRSGGVAELREFLDVGHEARQVLEPHSAR